MSLRTFDYESKQQYSIRVRSDRAYGESTEKQISISLIDVNERPEMSKIPFELVCANGIILCKWIHAAAGSYIYIFSKGFRQV